ncbi:MAG TPA: KEOPS complex N(6)-L-threonylcarbamoyladenine synthase Kae1 [Nitrososphaerales archaeon]|nr:KEOPS complex N(6)-L-threonylcarbamoyladenine synthase Kae1 [Nitrososphaerales archaeon]
MRGHLKVLGIESTAHTFSASLVTEREGVLTNAKDIYMPREGSGIHPAEAAEHHLAVAVKVVHEALERKSERGSDLDDVDAIAYSMGPGLGPCLRVGAVAARTLALSTGKPLVAVNHAVGHIELGCLLTGAKTPLVLLISGGHTMVVAHSNGVWRVLGETLDLTLGQLLDQMGRFVGFASPCGRKIEEAAAKSSRYLKLPYTVKGNDVSFSGVLTAAKKLIGGGASFEDVCYSLQETAFAITTEVTERALAFTGARELLVVGGVAANRRLSGMLETMATRHRATVEVVPPQFSGDCGAQIAWTGLLAFRAGEHLSSVADSVVRQSWRLDTVPTPWRS